MSCIQKILNFQIEIKLHHWSTTSYAQHMALGKLYETLDVLLDTFAETYIGIKGRGEVNEIKNLVFNGATKINIMNVLNSFEEYLKNEVENELAGETALLNIRDEMLASVQQTKYLLTLS
jgi:hypothetical protein